MLSIILSILLLIPLLVVFWLFYTVARFLLLKHINPWRESQNKKPYSSRVCTIVSILFAFAFIL